MGENLTITIAVPSVGSEGLEESVTRRFGRCAYFTFVNIANGSISDAKSIKNPGSDAFGGAGPVAVNFISGQGVTAVIGGDYGPNAANALNMGKIAMYGYVSTEPKKVQQLVDEYLQEKLPKVTEATGKGFHHK